MAPKTQQQNNPLQNFQKAFGFGPKPSGPAPARSFNPSQATAQQAVLNNLGSGGVLRGAQPANPFARIQSLLPTFGQAGYNNAQIPNLGAARLNGEEILINRGGYTPGIAELGEINSGGQRFFPAKRGEDLIYRRGVGENDKRAVGGQYGNLLPRGSSQDPSIDTYVPPGERSYQQEVSRTAQLTAQDPELKRYENVFLGSSFLPEYPAPYKKALRISSVLPPVSVGAAAVTVGATGVKAVAILVSLPGLVCRNCISYGLPWGSVVDNVP